MSIIFRNSFIGFNKDDVLDYVHKKDAELNSLSKNLNATISELEDEIKALNNELEALNNSYNQTVKENMDLRVKLNEFEEKTAEIENLSTKIGKLYLVSRSSAKTIGEKAEENSAVINSQVEENLSNIENANTVVNDITHKILSACESFASELSYLNTSLEEAKTKVTGNTEKTVKISAEFAEIYEKLI